MYILIKSRLASKLELETVYTLDEALKLYALHCMDMDIERGQAEELKAQQQKYMPPPFGKARRRRHNRWSQ